MGSCPGGVSRDEYGKTLLHYKAESELCLIAELDTTIKRWPLMIAIADNGGRYPLHWAVLSGRGLDVIQCLLDACPVAMVLE